jgi:hypothetical protein
MKSSQFATVAFGQHRGQDQLRRYARWRGRRDAGNDVTGDPVGHLVAQRWVELCCPREKLACHLSLARGQPGQLQ